MSIDSDQLHELRELLERHRQHIDQLNKEYRALEKIVYSVMPGVPSSSKRSARLIRAASDGNIEIVREELGKGVNPNRTNKDGKSALLLAMCRPNNLNVIRALLKFGADPNQADADGNTPLIVGVRDDAIDAVRELLQHGANINSRNKAGDTPLTNAACWDSRAVVQLLLSQGAKPMLPDGEGVVAADLAQQQGHTEIAALLRRRSK